jgi:hypothetical protein
MADRLAVADRTGLEAEVPIRPADRTALGDASGGLFVRDSGGEPGRIRTFNLVIKSHLLYR